MFPSYQWQEEGNQYIKAKLQLIPFTEKHHLLACIITASAVQCIKMIMHFSLHMLIRILLSFLRAPFEEDRLTVESYTSLFFSRCSVAINQCTSTRISKRNTCLHHRMWCCVLCKEKCLHVIFWAQGSANNCLLRNLIFIMLQFLFCII